MTSIPEGLPARHAPGRPAPMRWMSAALRTVSSMRFAINLLIVLAVGSMIGTVVQQGQPKPRYVDQYGVTGARIIDLLDLHAVYSAWWFVLILFFLVLSTSLCLVRNGPLFVKEFISFKERARVESLASHRYKASGVCAQSLPDARTRVLAVLSQHGWRCRIDQRPDGVMVAGKAGGTHRLGYLFAHGAIALVCVGGLLDGELPVRAQAWVQGLVPAQDDGLDPQSPRHRLGVDNPSYRGNVRVKEGGRVNLAEVTVRDGILLQPLPFDLSLVKFNVDYYEGGMPRRFASDIVVHDLATGRQSKATVEVNRPFSYQGVTLYQSGFMDGGSSLKLRAWPMANAFQVAPQAKGWALDAAVHGSVKLPAAFGDDGQPVTLELTDLRVINVQASPEGPQASSPGAPLSNLMGAGRKAAGGKPLRNVGPSVVYKLRDGSGQATEFEHYMLPVHINGRAFIVVGRRASAAEAFRYLRIPADEGGGIAGWVRLRWALMDPDMREQAAHRYVERALPGGNEQMLDMERRRAAGALALFAGAAAWSGAAAPQQGERAGFAAISALIEETVPAAQRPAAYESVQRLLEGGLLELHVLSRQRAGERPPADPDVHRRFMIDAVGALSDSFEFGAPSLITMESFDHVQASVFQVSRTPGKGLVYLGAAFLLLGVVVMLYVNERRLWVWLRPDPADADIVHVSCAMSSNRHRSDLGSAFAAISTAVLTGSTSKGRS